MDHGPILSTKRVKTYNRDYSTLHNELAELGAILLLKVISQHITGQLSAKEQNHKKTTFTKILERDDGKIDWSKKVEKIEAQIRAYRPWPGTWCYTDSSKKIKIIKATINETESKNKNFGKIINSPANGKMIVLCKKGSLVIEELQLEGKNKITGEEFLRGNNNIITLV